MLNNQGVDGIVVCATTGESTLLRDDEYEKVASVTIEQVKKRAQETLTMLGTTSLDPQQTIARNQLVLELGFDAVLVSHPPYIKPDKKGIIAFFETIASASPNLPIFIYNIWYRTGGQGLDAQTIIELAKINNIYGIKDCGCSIEHTDTVLANTKREDFVYLSGEDLNLFDVLTHGGDGAIAFSAHIVGKEMKNMIDAVSAGNLALALAIHRKIKPLIQTLLLEPNPAPLKQCLTELGMNVGVPRAPTILPVEDHTKILIKRALDAFLKK